MHINDVIAVLVGIVLASVWNFALSSKFVWGVRQLICCLSLGNSAKPPVPATHR
jgi:hypothetical protein